MNATVYVPTNDVYKNLSRLSQRTTTNNIIFTAYSLCMCEDLLYYDIGTDIAAKVNTDKSIPIVSTNIVFTALMSMLEDLLYDDTGTAITATLKYQWYQHKSFSIVSTTNWNQ